MEGWRKAKVGDEEKVCLAKREQDSCGIGSAFDLMREEILQWKGQNKIQLKPPRYDPQREKKTEKEEK